MHGLGWVITEPEPPNLTRPFRDPRRPIPGPSCLHHSGVSHDLLFLGPRTLTGVCVRPLGQPHQNLSGSGPSGVTVERGRPPHQRQFVDLSVVLKLAPLDFLALGLWGAPFL